MIWLLLVPAYLVGTFPNAAIVARSRGIDIQQVGSGNPGASNVARMMGTKWGVVVFILDGLKGAIPAAAGVLLDNRAAAYGMLAAAVLGHMFPITRRFKGGKGVATMGGGAMVLQPILSLAMLMLWVIVRKLSGKASIASLAIMIGLPVAVAVKGAPGWEIATLVACNALVLVRHVDNIKRLLAGRELSASRTA
ncbi:MAG: glycerol-3-phosphate 1-O-acyltransferase PlsY [Actinomycetia bacterium]|nr:glycerol-3-phosphate 1-O-acyltransferase PlsY [Actinomycetes bacterium]